MPTTTNYGWTTPADTDLVKDGASAIRTLGSAIDTTTKNLNPETTLGDIAYRSSTANTKTRLALGTAGQVLTVNSGATAPEWATPTSGGMTLISTTTLTGATVNLTSIPQTYKNLQIVVQNYKPATDGDYLILRFNQDTNANRHTGFGEGFGNKAFDGTRQYISNSQDNTTAQGLTVVKIYDYTNSATWKFWDMMSIGNNQTTSTNLSYAWFPAAYNQTSAITSLQFANDLGGNFTSGTILLYGVK